MAAILPAVTITGSMTREILWALILGSGLSAVILAEFAGGPLMIVLLAVAFRLFLRTRLLDRARAKAERGLAGSMEGHAAMDMPVTADGSFARRLLSAEGFTAVSHVFVMEWAAILRDLMAGLLVAGAVAAWVPDRFWRSFFFAGDPLAAAVWGPLIGPVVAIASFVCSIGNVPLAVVLWQGGISFGGLGLVPARSSATVPGQGVSRDYTSWLNIVFLMLAAALVTRFLRTGGRPMLQMMGGSPASG